MDHKLFRHPGLGPLAPDQHVLALPGSESHRIWTFHPADDMTADALPHLAPPLPRSDRPAPAPLMEPTK
ncbi:hypothetical protein GCM10009863_56480 [Streptomyces axinellae]|uniref:Uncharacterized protein n=2 Tax=Streptomyces axinellae TaxID=552788 RepID=A0ABP6D7K1_9ACTN